MSFLSNTKQLYKLWLFLIVFIVSVIFFILVLLEVFLSIEILAKSFFAPIIFIISFVLMTALLFWARCPCCRSSILHEVLVKRSSKNLSIWEVAECPVCKYNP